MPDRETIHVLSCRYADNSTLTVLRAYASAERAEEDREMIEKTGPVMHPEVTAVALVEEG